jgi:hypothetical protein
MTKGYEDALRAYETDNYEAVRCSIEMEGMVAKDIPLDSCVRLIVELVDGTKDRTYSYNFQKRTEIGGNRSN